MQTDSKSNHTECILSQKNSKWPQKESKWPTDNQNGSQNFKMATLKSSISYIIFQLSWQ